MDSTSSNEEPFVMVTFDPKLPQRSFEYCNEHAVYTNDPETVGSLPKPCAPSLPPQFVERTFTNTVNVHNITRLKVCELVQEIINEVQDANQPDGPVNTDADVVRALFYWLASQDIRTTEYGISPSFQRVSYQLQLLKEKRNTYAAFFSLLCHHAGIPCVIIQGYVKGSKYSIGDGLSGKLLREWNAVLVNGEWQLVDVFWGSQTTAGQEINPWFLFPNPQQLIYSHLPETKAWQLLKNPISAKTFEQHAYLKQRFFEMGLHLVSTKNKKCCIDVENGESDMLFQIDPDREESQEFKVVVTRLNENKVWQEVKLPSKNVSLDFVSKLSTNEDIDNDFDQFEEEMLSESDIKYDALSVKVRFPKSGIYKLEMLGLETQQRDSKSRVASRMKQRRDQVGHHFDWVAIYKLVADSVPDWPVYFPKMPVNGWGRNAYLNRCGLRLHLPVSGTFTCFPGLLELKFKILINAPTRNIKLRYVMKDTAAKLDDKAAVKEDDDDKVDPSASQEAQLEYDSNSVDGDIITLQVNIEVGEKIITVFARLNTTEKGEVCNYLVNCKEPEKEFGPEELNTMRDQLKTAEENKDLDQIREAVFSAKTSGMFAHKVVRFYYRLAFTLMKRMVRYQNLLKKIQTIDNNVILSIKSLNAPYPLIVQVLQATFILLENKEYTWDGIRPKLTTLGKESIKLKIENKKVADINLRQINKAKQFTKGITAAEMIDKCAEVAPFLKWVEMMIDQHSMVARQTSVISEDSNQRPAVARQTSRFSDESSQRPTVARQVSSFSNESNQPHKVARQVSNSSEEYNQHPLLARQGSSSSKESVELKQLPPTVDRHLTLPVIEETQT